MTDRIAAFFALVVLFSVLYRLLIAAVSGYIRRPRQGSAGASLDRLLGAAVGLAEGVVTVTLLVTALSLLGSSGRLERLQEGSRLRPPLVALASRAGPPVQSALAVRDGTGFLGMTAPDTGSAIRLNFPTNLDLTYDEPAETRMLGLVNEARRQAGLQPLRADPALRAVARAHSRDMFLRSYFRHVSPDGSTPDDRLRRARIPFLVAGENLAYQPNAVVAHNALMNSAGHRANILSPVFRRVGIGAVRGGLYGEMITQVFTN